MCPRIDKFMLLIMLCCLTAGDLGADSKNLKNEETVNSTITEVTVYQNRARVIREVTLSLSEGDHSLLFENIPILSDVSSFHASASGEKEPLILGLSHQIKEHLKTPQEKVANLEKEILDIEQGRKMIIDYKLAVLERKREFLLSILKQAGQTMSEEIERGDINAISWGDAYDFFGSNLGILSDSLRQYRLWSETLKDSLNIKKRRLDKIRSSRGNRTRLVQVDLRIETEGEITIALDYVVSNAGWVPIYDARLNLGGETTKLELFAEIKQKTGEDWNDVNLTLSTAEPTRSAGPGKISNWYLSDATPVYYNRSNNSGYAHDLDKVIRVSAKSKGIDKYVSSDKVTISRKDIEAMPIQNVDELLQQTAGVVTTNEGEIIIRGGRAGEVAYIVDGVRIGDPLGGHGPVNLGLSLTGSTMGLSNYAATFETSRKETVISGEKSVRVLLTKWNLEAKTNLICRPKLNQSVFRQVEITNQFDSPLLPGMVNLFAGSDFIGKTSLYQLIAPGQTFDLPFGVENRVEVKRKIISIKKSVYDDKIKIIQTIEIKLKNWSKFEGSLTLEEPFPVSQDNRIKTKYKKMNPKPDNIDKQGKAEWNLVLKPGEEKIINFTFEISHPKGMRLSGM